MRKPEVSFPFFVIVLNVFFERLIARFVFDLVNFAVLVYFLEVLHFSLSINLLLLSAVFIRISALDTYLIFGFLGWALINGHHFSAVFFFPSTKQRKKNKISRYTKTEFKFCIGCFSLATKPKHKVCCLGLSPSNRLSLNVTSAQQVYSLR